MLLRALAEVSDDRGELSRREAEHPGFGGAHDVHPKLSQEQERGTRKNVLEAPKIFIIENTKGKNTSEWQIPKTTLSQKQAILKSPGHPPSLAHLEKIKTRSVFRKISPSWQVTKKKSHKGPTTQEKGNTI